MAVLENLALKSLPLEPRRNLTLLVHHRQFPAGETLFASGSTIPKLFFLNSGAVSLATPLTGSETIQFAIVGRERLIGGAAALGTASSVYQVSVQVQGEGYSLDVDIARKFAEDYAELRSMIGRHEQLVLAQSEQSLACNAVHNIDQRLARWLLRLRDAAGSDKLLVTQDMMSQMLGVQRTSITLSASKFQHMGWISYTRSHLKTFGL
jgi:CRP-like cAMP-binding protein